MVTFEIILCLLVAGVGLAMLAPQLGLPWPAVLALAGTGLAFIPGVPAVPLDPDLALALFFAPVLLDAAYGTSPRTLLKNWRPVGSLVIVAVLLTVSVVAVVARAIVPDMPWAAAIALGAIVAPPDAAAATSVLRQVQLPQRLVMILEGESLLNDASVLLIYRAALDAVHGDVTVWTLPISLLAAAGGIVLGYALARTYMATVARVMTHENMSESVLLQFLGTFAVWILADKLDLSAVLTVVAYGMTIARYSRGRMGPRERRLSFGIWEVVVFGLNVLAFLITGLQIRLIFNELNKSWNYLALAASVLVACIVVRMGWVLIYTFATRWNIMRGPRPRAGALKRITPQTAVVVGWAGMRGIVTLGTALALPADFPQRALIQFTAFAIVLGTLGFQGLTLKPLIARLTLPGDTSEDEVMLARSEAVRAGLASLGDDSSRAAQLLMRQYETRLAADGEPVDVTGLVRLQRRALEAERGQIVALHHAGKINDEVFAGLEEELDWSEAALDQTRDAGLS